MRKIKAVLTWSVAVGMIFSFSSCLKTSEPTKNPAQAYVSIMYLATSTNTPAVDIFFNTQKVTGTAYNPGAVSSAYSALPKDNYAVYFKKAGGDSSVATLPASQYDSLGFYTIFLFNQSSGAVTATLIEDDYSDLTLDKPFLRFFHASPGTAALGEADLYMDNTKVTGLSGRTLGDNQYSGYFNEYQPTTAGSHKFEVKVTINSKDSVIATLNDQALIAGNAYTLYLKGNPGGTGTNAPALGILRAAN